MADITTPAPQPRPHPKVPGLVVLVLAVVTGLTATACALAGSGDSGRASETAAIRVAPAPDTVVLDNGKALAPRNAPATVVDVIAAANRLVGLPYRYGGGHGPYPGPGQQPDGKLDTGYDGSGATSFVLHAAGLLPEPLSAEQLGQFGRPGPGHWVTILVCADGAHMIIAGMAFDAHPGPSDSHAGPHWRAVAPDSDSGCVVRHPDGS